jgi:hypothetical protein
MTARGFTDSGSADLLLRCLSRYGLGTGDWRPGTVDWTRVADVAVREHVAPLLFKRLKESGARDCVPSDAWERLRRAYFTNGDRNARLYRELQTVLQLLRGSGIKVVVLKGAYLAEAVYGDLALRPMADVDLLVPRADLARAGAVLLGMGGARLKRHDEAEPAPGAHREDVKPNREMKRHAHPILVHGLAVELHWTIVSPTGPFRIDADGLWDRARPAMIAGVEVLSLSPEDLLLHLCLHFCYQDGCKGLRYLCDVAETIHRFRDEMNWLRVADLAREWGAARYAWLALRLAADMFDAGVPHDVLERLVPAGIDQSLLTQARECVLAHEAYDNWSLLPFPNRLGGKWTLERAKAIRDALLLSRDELALRYPTARDARHLWPYHVLRLVGLPRTYGRATLRRGFRLMRVRKRDSTSSLDGWLKSGKQ